MALLPRGAVQLIPVETVILITLVTVTSSLAGWIGWRHAWITTDHLRRAMFRTMHLIGWCVMFFAVNIVVGVIGILAVRTLLGGRFVSVYVLDDVSLIVLSALQGLVVGLCRMSAGAAPPPAGAAREP